jgi:hypothetical protein
MGGHPPDTSGNEYVEDTEAITPMIENANAIVSNIFSDEEIFLVPYGNISTVSNSPRTLS